MTDTVDAARAWARGIYPSEAGVELLIRGRLLVEGSPWVAANGYVDVDRLLEESGPWSGGERRLVTIAASLLGGPAVDLSEAIPGLDRGMLALVLAAVAHAGGSHEHSGFHFDDDGRPTGVASLDSLYPWPDQAVRA